MNHMTADIRKQRMILDDIESFKKVAATFLKHPMPTENL